MNNLNKEKTKDFDFFSKNKLVKKPFFSKKAIQGLIATPIILLVLLNIATYSVIFDLNDQLEIKEDMAQQQYEMIIADLNDNKYDLESIKKLDKSNEFLIRLKELENNNLMVADVMAADIMLQIYLDKNIKEEVKNELYEEYKKTWDQGLNNEKLLFSNLNCFLNYPCYEQKDWENKNRKELLFELMEKRESIESLKKLTIAIPKQPPKDINSHSLPYQP